MRRIRNRRSTAQIRGDAVESDRLRLPFLAWVGRRSNADGLKAAGIPHHHGMAWLAETTVLRAEYQIKVRKLLDAAGILRSPC